MYRLYFLEAILAGMVRDTFFAAYVRCVYERLPRIVNLEPTGNRAIFLTLPSETLSRQLLRTNEILFYEQLAIV